MIYAESKKLHLIASLIEENDVNILKKIEEILFKQGNRPSSKFADFHNQLTDQELEEFEKNIENGCEQINENDWK